MIGPSWQEDNITDSCLEQILEQIKDRDYDIIVRPHPQEVRLKVAFIESIKEKYKDGDQAANRKAIQEETMQLYRKYNINPMSAIFPMFLQIPIFFALYKVLVISIEMRDAPFIGWIVDLSTGEVS